ncbi:MAG: WXG100 family type VII secretion target [Lachnospiraceae bacterium]|nr:WXG100 family type VII secretion target [Lachnospiraceae bacterium]
MATIKVTASTMRSKKQSLENDNLKLKRQISRMDSLESQLMSAWQGEAAKTFDAVYKRDAVCYSKFHALIEQYCQALDNIIKAYEAAEASNVQIARTRSFK